MRKASSLFVLILLGSLVADAVAQTRPGQGQHPGQGHGQGQGQHHPGQQPGHIPGTSFPPYQQPGSQQGQIISERVMQTVRMYEHVRLSDLLRLQYQESSLEVRSLTILASSIRGQAQLDVLSSLGQSLGSGIVRRQLGEVRIQLPARTRLGDIEIAASEEILLDTVTAEVERSYGPGPGPLPLPEQQPLSGQNLKLALNQSIRISGELPLKALVKQQLGLTLEGAQIERIAIQATVMSGRAATLQVEMNQRIIATKQITGAQRATPIPLNTFEEVRGNLRLHVRGDIVIHQVNIRVGQVRQIPQHGGGRSERILVSQEVSSGRPLELIRVMPYETRLISSISIEARTLRHSSAELAVVALGQVVGSTIVTTVPMRPVIQLMRPMSARELRLQSLSPVIIDAIEVDFDRYQTW